MLGLIAVLLVLSLLAVALLAMLSSGLMEDVESQGWLQAFLAAESGVSAAKTSIMTNDAWDQHLPYTLTGAVGAALFSATVDASNSPGPVVTSTGIHGDSRWTSVWTGSATGEMRALCVYQTAAVSSPRYRAYAKPRDILLAEQTAQAVGAVPQWQRLLACPQTNTFLLVAQTASRQVWAQAYTNGGWAVSTQLNLTGLVPTASRRGFDVAQESRSGRIMAVYSVGTGTPQYRIWNGSSWSGQLPITVNAADPIQWVRLVSQPKSNQLLLMVRWIRSTKPFGNCSAAVVWTGSAWSNLIALEVSAKSDITCDAIDGAFTTNSAIVVYLTGKGVETRMPNYRRYVNAAWGAEGTVGVERLGGVPQWIRVEGNPNGTNAYAVFLDSRGKLSGIHWNGGAWDAMYNVYSNVTLETATERSFDLAWCSRSNLVMVAYGPTRSATHAYMVQALPGAPAYGTMAAGTDLGHWSVLRSDPLSSEMLYLSLDGANDACVQRWDGRSWKLAGKAETNSSLTYNSIDAAFRSDRP